MRDRSLLNARNARIRKRHRDLCAQKKFRIDYIMSVLEKEFFLKAKTIYEILREDEPDAIQPELFRAA